MKCPHCAHDGKTYVLETRGEKRLRCCGKCGKNFVTLETAMPAGTVLREPRPERRGRPVRAPAHVDFGALDRVWRS